MTHTPDTPQPRRNEHIPREPKPRMVGSEVLHTTGVKVARGHERHVNELDRLKAETRAVVAKRIWEERQSEPAKALNRSVVNRAFMNQQRRLQRKDIVEDMTHSQLMCENMATAVLFAPTISDAIENDYHRDMSRYNDLLANVVLHTPPKHAGQIAPVIRGESLALNDFLKHKSAVSEDDYIETHLRGVRPELAVIRSAGQDPDLSVAVGSVSEDLRGIDLSVMRVSDSARACFDVKAHTKFENTARKFLDYDTPTLNDALRTGYLKTGRTVEGVSQYILDATKCGEVPERGFDFSPEDAEHTQALIHEILDNDIR